MEHAARRSPFFGGVRGNTGVAIFFRNDSGSGDHPEDGERAASDHHKDTKRTKKRPSPSSCPSCLCGVPFYGAARLPIRKRGADVSHVDRVVRPEPGRPGGPRRRERSSDEMDRAPKPRKSSFRANPVCLVKILFPVIPGVSVPLWFKAADRIGGTRPARLAPMGSSLMSGGRVLPHRHGRITLSPASASRNSA